MILYFFTKQNYIYKCFISGNHELGLDYGPMREIKLKIIFHILGL